MTDTSKDDETEFNETLKRMLKTPPKLHVPKPAKKPPAKGSEKKQG